MKNKTQFLFLTIFLLFIKNLFCYEIIRDPIFEHYFTNLNKELKLEKVNVYLIKNKLANAFVINDKIYFTTGLFNSVSNEDTIKAIYLHEYGHIIKNHFQAKKIEILQSKNKKNLYNIFSIGIAVISGSPNIGIGASVTLDNNLINEISNHSINYEIEADNYMINQIKKYKINTTELILFLKKNDLDDKYFKSHPRSKDRINNLKILNYKLSDNSSIFEWLKSKYSKNSKNKKFNKFFKDLDKGIYNNKNIKSINKHILQYEAYKKGIKIENLQTNFQELIKINNNAFLKIEYMNYILENNLHEKYYFIENIKFNKSIMSEYFYYYIYGKYYDKLGNIDLSNFYLCQFYKSINSKNKADFFCKKYDIKDIPTLDKSYALFK